MIEQQIIEITTKGRGLIDLSARVREVVAQAGVKKGLCQLFIMHTSASLLLGENADPTVQDDLERFLSHLVPDGDPMFAHLAEGPDDMPSHIRSVLTSTDITIPIAAGELLLGTWQGIYLYEHRLASHRRKVAITVLE